MTEHPIPVIILARMAVARRNQGRGIGTGMLQSRAVLASPVQQQQLLLLLKDQPDGE